MNDMESLKILLLCVDAAIVYGILHDQVTARVCVEYFTVGHPPVFDTDSPTLLAFGWGFIATWWVGLILSAPAIAVCRLGKWPKRDAIRLVWPIIVLLAVMACGALTAGIVGYYLAKSGSIQLIDRLAASVPSSKHAAFLADFWAHNASYAIGSIGGLMLCGWVLLQRRKESRTLDLAGVSADENRWDISFASSQSALAEMAAEALQEDAEGRTENMDKLMDST